jgi:16S rRNA processing protein RimM
VFGVRGELKCDPTPAGSSLFRNGISLTASGPDAADREVRIARVRQHKNRVLVAFDGIETPEAAEPLVGSILFAARERIELQPDEYLDADLIGCRLIDDDGRVLGTVTAVEHYPASDMLVIGPARRLVPLLREFVRAVDLPHRRIAVAALPPGLLDDRAEEA